MPGDKFPVVSEELGSLGGQEAPESDLRNWLSGPWAKGCESEVSVKGAAVWHVGKGPASAPSLRTSK